MRAFFGRLRRSLQTRRARGILLVTLVILLLAILAPAALLAQSGGPYSLTWWTIGGGGGQSTGGPFVVDTTVGQPAAGSQSGGAYTVLSGFWAAALPSAGETPTPTPTRPPGQYRVFLPLLAQGF